MFTIFQDVFVIETKYIRIYREILYILLILIMVILFMKFYAETKLNIKEILKLNMMKNVVNNLSRKRVVNLIVSYYIYL